MAVVFASPHATPNGSYVVSGPVGTDTIGTILRASFVAKDADDNSFARLIAQIDRVTPNT